MLCSAIDSFMKYKGIGKIWFFSTWTNGGIPPVGCECDKETLRRSSSQTTLTNEQFFKDVAELV